MVLGSGCDQWDGFAIVEMRGSVDGLSVGVGERGRGELYSRGSRRRCWCSGGRSDLMQE